MRKLGVWGVAAVLAFGLAGPRLLAGEGGEGPPAAAPGFWGRLFGRTSGPKGKEPDPAEVEAQRAAAEAQAREQRRQADARRARDEFLRRQAVCTRLLLIAAQTDDAALQKKAEELNERAWTVYRMKTAGRTAGRVEGFEPDPGATAGERGKTPRGEEP